MNSTVISPEELLERAIELVKSDGNMEMMNHVAILRGYLELRTLDPDNGIYRQNVENAVSTLLEAAHEHSHWRQRLRLQEAYGE